MAAKSSPKKKTPAKPSKRKYIVYLWLLALAPLLGLTALFVIASMGDLPDTDTLANPKTNLASEVYTADKTVIGKY